MGYGTAPLQRPNENRFPLPPPPDGKPPVRLPVRSDEPTSHAMGMGTPDEQQPPTPGQPGQPGAPGEDILRMLGLFGGGNRPRPGGVDY